MRCVRALGFIAALLLGSGVVAAEVRAVDNIGGDDRLVVELADIGNSDLAITSFGYIFAVIEVDDPEGGLGLQLYRSTDGGDSFSLWGQLALSLSTTTFSQPSLAVTGGADPQVHLAFVRRSLFQNDSIQMVSASPYGSQAEFSTPLVVLAQAGWDYSHPHLATDADSYSDHNLYVVGVGRGSSGYESVTYARIHQGSVAPVLDIAYEEASSQEFQNPRITCGYGGMVHVAYALIPANTVDFDPAIMYRRCPDRGVGGLATWTSTRWLTTNMDGVSDFNPRLAASPTSPAVVVAYRRYVMPSGPYENAGLSYSQNYGDTWIPVDPSPDLYVPDQVLFQPETNDFIIYTTDSGPAFWRADRLNLNSWEGPFIFGDQVYPYTTVALRGMAVSPAHDGRLAVLWSYPELDPEETVPYYFDAEWRDDPGYANLEDGFPLTMDGYAISSPLLVDLDHDGDLEIVFTDLLNTVCRLVALHHTGEAVDGWPVSVPGSLMVTSPVAVGQMVVGGPLSVLVGSAGGEVFGYWEDGTPMPGYPFSPLEDAPSFVTVGALGGNHPRVAVVTCGNRFYKVSPEGVNLQSLTTTGEPFTLPAAIGDVDGDGHADIVVVHGDRFAILKTQGSSVLSGFAAAYVTGAPTLGDLDGDGVVEIILPCAGGTIEVFTDGGYEDLPGWPRETGHGLAPSAVVLSRVPYAAFLPALIFGEQGTHVYRYLSDGSTPPYNDWPVTLPLGYAAVEPVLGYMESYPPTVLLSAGTPTLHGLDYHGEAEMGWPRTVTTSLNTSPALGDIDQDGHGEVVYMNGNILHILDTGAAPASTLTNWTMAGYDPGRTRCYMCPEEIVAPVPDEPVAVTRVSFAAPSPNPTTGRTVFAYALPVRAVARLEIFDVRGRRVAEVLRSEQEMGRRQVTWDGADSLGRPVSGGTYFARLRVEGPGLREELVRKVTVLR